MTHERVCVLAPVAEVRFPGPMLALSQEEQRRAGNSCAAFGSATSALGQQQRNKNSSIIMGCQPNKNSNNRLVLAAGDAQSLGVGSREELRLSESAIMTSTTTLYNHNNTRNYSSSSNSSGYNQCRIGSEQNWQWSAEGRSASAVVQPTHRWQGRQHTRESVAMSKDEDLYEQAYDSEGEVETEEEGGAATARVADSTYDRDWRTDIKVPYEALFKAQEHCLSLQVEGPAGGSIGCKARLLRGSLGGAILPPPVGGMAPPHCRHHPTVANAAQPGTMAPLPDHASFGRQPPMHFTGTLPMLGPDSMLGTGGMAGQLAIASPLSPDPRDLLRSSSSSGFSSCSSPSSSIILLANSAPGDTRTGLYSKVTPALSVEVSPMASSAMEAMSMPISHQPASRNMMRAPPRCLPQEPGVQCQPVACGSPPARAFFFPSSSSTSAVESCSEEFDLGRKMERRASGSLDSSDATPPRLPQAGLSQQSQEDQYNSISESCSTKDAFSSSSSSKVPSSNHVPVGLRVISRKTLQPQLLLNSSPACKPSSQTSVRAMKVLGTYSSPVRHVAMCSAMHDSPAGGELDRLASFSTVGPLGTRAQSESGASRELSRFSSLQEVEKQETEQTVARSQSLVLDRAAAVGGAQRHSRAIGRAQAKLRVRRERGIPRNAPLPPRVQERSMRRAVVLGEDDSEMQTLEPIQLDRSRTMPCQVTSTRTPSPWPGESRSPSPGRVPFARSNSFKGSATAHRPGPMSAVAAVQQGKMVVLSKAQRFSNRLQQGKVSDALLHERQPGKETGRPPVQPGRSGSGRSAHPPLHRAGSANDTHLEKGTEKGLSKLGHVHRRQNAVSGELDRLLDAAPGVPGSRKQVAAAAAADGKAVFGHSASLPTELEGGLRPMVSSIESSPGAVQPKSSRKDRKLEAKASGASDMNKAMDEKSGNKGDGVKSTTRQKGEGAVVGLHEEAVEDRERGVSVMDDECLSKRQNSLGHFRGPERDSGERKEQWVDVQRGSSEEKVKTKEDKEEEEPSGSPRPEECIRMESKQPKTILLKDKSVNKGRNKKKVTFSDNITVFT